MPFRNHVFLVAVVLLGLSTQGCSRPGGAGASRGGPGGMPPMPVDVAQVRTQSVRDGFEALGTLEARDRIEVASESNGVVRELPFAEGQTVARGALLARLDDREIRAEAARASAVLEQARANHGRVERLFAQKAVSAQELERFGTDLKVASANHGLARTRLDKTRIRAAFSGVVGRRRVSPGAYLQAGDVITELARVDELELAFDAPERYAGRVGVGTKVEIRPAAYPERRYTGTITTVDPMVDVRSRTMRLVARIPNPRRVLLPGMSAQVLVTLQERPSALVVPDEAVFAEGSQSFVFVVKPDSTVARAVVTLGVRDSSLVEVVHGLNAGDRVVRAGHQKLFDGAKVMPVQAGSS
jgi:membrane fusion protein (multidrug efflux system)